MEGDFHPPSPRKGQSVLHILRANGELFTGYADSTVYGRINDGLFAGAGRSMLPFACSRRRPHKKSGTWTNAKCRAA